MEPTSPGYRTFEIRPTMPEGLDWVKYYQDTMYGRIVSEWNKGADGSLTIKIAVPVGTTCTAYVPDGESTRTETLSSGKYTLKGSIK